jgi:hypothetical protein
MQPNECQLRTRLFLPFTHGIDMEALEAARKPSYFLLGDVDCRTGS